MARLLWEQKRRSESLAPGDVSRTPGKAGICPVAMGLTGKLTRIGPNFPAGKGRPRLHFPSLHSLGVFFAEVTLSSLLL